MTTAIRPARRVAGLITATALLMGGTAVAFSGPASAKGREVISRGTCTGGGAWKLKAKDEDGRIGVEFEVDTNRAGQRWSVTIKDNGVTVYSGTRTTLAPSGSFSVERIVANRAGTDRITAVATRGTAKCSGAVSF